LTRRRFLGGATALGLALSGGGLAACVQPGSGGSGKTPEAAGPSLPGGQTARTGRLTAVLPNSELAVGPNSRFLLGILDKDNKPIANADVKLRFFTLSGSQVPQQANATYKFPADTTFFTSPAIGERGVYVARVSFDAPGSWAVEVQATPPGGQAEVLRLFLRVDERTKTPPVGTVPPASKTPVARATPEAERICSARPVDDMHDLSIGDVLGKGKPLAVLFATPAFCTTQLCGPDLEVVQAMKAKFGDRVQFIHIETWQDATPGKLVATVEEWKLPSEPWLFLMDGQGKVVDKLEGGITVQEVEPIFARLAAS
jgi:hypothetical protein